MIKKIYISIFYLCTEFQSFPSNNNLYFLYTVTIKYKVTFQKQFINSFKKLYWFFFSKFPFICLPYKYIPNISI